MVCLEKVAKELEELPIKRKNFVWQKTFFVLKLQSFLDLRSMKFSRTAHVITSYHKL